MIFIFLLLLFPILTHFSEKNSIFNKIELNGLAFSTTSEASL